MAKTKPRDLSVICWHCNEPKGLHAALGLTCPPIEHGRDDYEERDTRFEPKPKTQSPKDSSKP